MLWHNRPLNNGHTHETRIHLIFRKRNNNIIKRYDSAHCGDVAKHWGLQPFFVLVQRCSAYESGSLLPHERDIQSNRDNQKITFFRILISHSYLLNEPRSWFKSIRTFCARSISSHPRWFNVSIQLKKYGPCAVKSHTAICLCLDSIQRSRNFPINSEPSDASCDANTLHCTA